MLKCGAKRYPNRFRFLDLSMQGSNMNDKQFQKLLDKAVKSAKQHRDLIEKVGQECIARYGHHYSDIDCDYLIDGVDHGLVNVTVAKIDEEFKRHIEIRGLNKDDKSA